MKITSTNNLSFKGASTKADKTDKKSSGAKRYFETISKNSVNDAILLSKDREEQDGKYKAIASAADLGAIITGAGAALSAIAKSNKTLKNNKAFCILASASVILAGIATRAEVKNKVEANKTAKERGVEQFEKRYYTSTVADFYKNAEKEYGKHVK